MTDEQQQDPAAQAPAASDATDPNVKPVDDTASELAAAPPAEMPVATSHGSMPMPSPEAMTAAEEPAPTEEPSLTERAHALVAAYEHGMATNGPRTLAELKEIKALFGVD